MHVRRGKDGDVRIDAEIGEKTWQEKRGDEQKGSQGEAEVDAVDEGVVAIIAAAGPEGLGDKSIEPDEETFAEKDENKVEAGTDADCCDGLGAIGEAADRHGVYNGHGNPADFGEDEGQGQMEGGPELGAEGGPGKHLSVYGA